MTLRTTAERKNQREKDNIRRRETRVPALKLSLRERDHLNS